MSRSLWLASLRMVVQLLLVGYVLQWIFTLRSPGVILAIASGTALGTMGIVMLAFRALFSQKHRLRLERLHMVK